MLDSTRRKFLQQTGAGLAALGSAGLVLRSDAQPTQEVNRDRSDRILIQMGPMVKEGITAKTVQDISR
jgi:hypothetical protein